MDWRRMAGIAGRVLLVGGLLVLAFAAYQLWGTGLHEAAAQRSLERQFDERLRGAGVTSTTSATTTTVSSLTSTLTSVSPTTGTSTTTAALPAPLLEEGDAVARLEIPRIGLDKIVVAGVGVDDLRRGPGHYPQTPLPGQLGNAAIAGHRTTYGAPFSRIDELEVGDEILVTTLQGRFRYLVTGQEVVAPTDLGVLDPTDEATLTLTSCHPRFSARERIIVTATLEPAPIVPPAPATPAYAGLVSPATGVTVPPADVDPEDAPTVVALGEGFDDGWFADASAWWPTLGWGTATAAAATVAWWVGRRWRRWPTYAVATPVVLVLLVLCFGGVARLLPANL